MTHLQTLFVLLERRHQVMLLLLAALVFFQNVPQHRRWRRRR
jgi:hypothetical protein